MDHRGAETGGCRTRCGVSDPRSEEAVTGGVAGEVDGGGIVRGHGGFEGGVCQGEDGMRFSLEYVFFLFLFFSFFLVCGGV